MKFRKGLLSLLLILAGSFTVLSAQSGGNGSSLLLNSLYVIAAIVFFAIVVQVSDNLMVIEAKRIGADKSGQNFGLIPRMQELFSPRLPEYLEGQQLISSRKGFDIPLEGAPDARVLDRKVLRFGINAADMRGMAPIPRLQVEVGDPVKAGDPLFFDKSQPDLVVTAPVSGEVVEIRRGERRALREIVILADKKQVYRSFPKIDLNSVSRENLVGLLASAGLMPLFRQRPFQILPRLNEIPRDIFVSTFDTAPLAPDAGQALLGREEAFRVGLRVLGKLTSGRVFLGLDGRGQTPPPPIFSEAEGVTKTYFRGAHPMGNVGVQIHHLGPIAPEDVVWTIAAQDIAVLGDFILRGEVRLIRRIALCGANLKNTGYVDLPLGASVRELLDGEDLSSDRRIISGDVLTGTKMAGDAFLGFYDDQLTQVDEGNQYELFGWLLPTDMRPSMSKTFPSTLLGGVPSAANTNTRGEKRAFVVTGEYDRLLPMDLLPQQLFKAILINDVEKMENLGIHELVEEDVALCEFGCTSKQPLQALLRDGLNSMQAEG